MKTIGWKEIEKAKKESRRKIKEGSKGVLVALIDIERKKATLI